MRTMYEMAKWTVQDIGLTWAFMSIAGGMHSINGTIKCPCGKRIEFSIEREMRGAPHVVSIDAEKQHGRLTEVTFSGISGIGNLLIYVIGWTTMVCKNDRPAHEVE